MKCDKCNNEARVFLNNTHNLCMDCYNKLLSEEFGYEYFDDFTRKIVISEPDGTVHTFEIEQMQLGKYTFWRAFETDGYEFALRVDTASDQKESVKQLHQKILKGISSKSLNIRQSPIDYISNAVYRGNKEYYLNETGVLRVAGDADGEIDVYIDGMKITGEEFLKMLTVYNGFNMEWKFLDISDKVDIPLKLNITTARMEEYWQKFERMIGRFAEHENFISYKRSSDLSEEIFEYLEIIEELIKHGNHVEAVELGERVIKRLEELETDDDNFPSYEIECVERILGR